MNVTVDDIRRHNVTFHDLYMQYNAMLVVHREADAAALLEHMRNLADSVPCMSVDDAQLVAEHVHETPTRFVQRFVARPAYAVVVRAVAARHTAAAVLADARTQRARSALCAILNDSAPTTNEHGR